MKQLDFDKATSLEIARWHARRASSVAERTVALLDSRHGAAGAEGAEAHEHATRAWASISAAEHARAKVDGVTLREHQHEDRLNQLWRILGVNERGPMHTWAALIDEIKSQMVTEFELDLIADAVGLMRHGLKDTDDWSDAQEKAAGTLLERIARWKARVG